LGVVAAVGVGTTALHAPAALHEIESNAAPALSFKVCTPGISDADSRRDSLVDDEGLRDSLRVSEPTNGATVARGRTRDAAQNYY